MNRLIPVAIIIGGLAFVGCATAHVQQIRYSEFHDYGDTPLSHTIYLGSDSSFHYFAWEHGKSGGNWKVAKAEMIISNEFASGTREAVLVKNPEGNWCAYPCQ